MSESPAEPKQVLDSRPITVLPMGIPSEMATYGLSEHKQLVGQPPLKKKHAPPPKTLRSAGVQRRLGPGPQPCLSCRKRRGLQGVLR